ncbi:MAG: hypothetical protein ACE5R6_14955, partial [Candidatus Heimdallarchaeota archaeon]
LFTFETNVSVSFNVTFNILFEKNLNYSALTAYYVNSSLQTADWNTTFSSVVFSPVDYLVYNRTYIINTFPTQWWSLTVYNGTNVYPSNMWDRTGTVLKINATQMYSDASNWRIHAISANYVTNVTVINPPGELGQSLSVNTTLNATYTPTSATLNLTYHSLSNGNWTGPTHNDLDTNPNPYTSNDVLQSSWPHGQYNVSAFYYSGVEVGLNVSSTTIAVYRPTALAITIPPGSVSRGTSFTMQVRLRDASKSNVWIGGAAVTFKTTWSSTPATTNAQGFADATIPTAGAPLGTQSIQVLVSGAGPPDYYQSTSTTGSVYIFQSAGISGLTFSPIIGYNDSTTIQVSYAVDATVTITIDENQSSMGQISSGRYSYNFIGTEWDLGEHQFTINANKPNHTPASTSGSIIVENNPTILRTTGLYASSVTFPDLQNDSTLQLAYTDTFELSLAYVDLIHNTTTGNASLTFDWMVGELSSIQSGAGGNYTLSIEGTTIGRHTLTLNMSKYGYQSQEFMMTFDVVNNPTALNIDPTIPENRTFDIEYTEEVMIGLHIEDTNHSLPLSTTPIVNGWTNYSVVESPSGNYSFTFYGDWVTPEEGQPVDIVFQPYGYEPQTFRFTFIVQHRTILMEVAVENEDLNVTAGESIIVQVQLNYKNGDPVPNVEVIGMFTVEFESPGSPGSALALNVASMQGTQYQQYNVTGTTDKQGRAVIPFTTKEGMHSVQIAVVFEGDVTKAAAGAEFGASIIVTPPVELTILEMLRKYWYLTLAAVVLISGLFVYMIRLTRRRMVYRVKLEKKIQRTYDFIMDIVNLDAIIGILRDGTAFYDLMIGEELDPQLYSSFLTALRTYAATTVAARPVEAEEEIFTEAVETEEKAHALMGDKESYIASGELISFAFVFTARFDETGQWQSISPITRETAREAVEEIEMHFEREILQFQESRDLSAIPSDYIYLTFSNILGLDFLKPHRTTRREKGLTKEEQKALKVARDIEALEGQILLPIVAERLIGEGMAKERAIYALQQLRVKGGVETVESRQVEEGALQEEERELEENAGEEGVSSG